MLYTTLTHLRGVFVVFSQAFQLWCIEKEQQEKERLVLLLQFCTGSHLNPLPVFFVLRIFRLFHYLNPIPAFYVVRKCQLFNYLNLHPVFCIVRIFQLFDYLNLVSNLVFVVIIFQFIQQYQYAPCILSSKNISIV